MRAKVPLAGLATSVVFALAAGAQAPAPDPAVPAPTARAWDALGPVGVPVVGTMLDHRDELALSASQVDALERLVTDFVRETIRRQADLLVAGVDLDSLLGPDPGRAVDLGGAEAKLREVERIRADQQVALLRVIEAGKALVNPDQRAKLATLMAAGAQSPDDPPAPAERSAHSGAPPSPRGAGSSAPGRAAPGAPGHPVPPPPPRGFGPHRPAVHGRGYVGIWAPFSWEPYWAYPAPPVIAPPPAVSPPPSYWYYCASAQAYYPYVSSCPEPWTLVTVTPP
jgi:hypothetical protein